MRENTLSLDLGDAGDAARDATGTGLYTLGGYTDILEAGRHPQWGGQVDVLICFVQYY